MQEKPTVFFDLPLPEERVFRYQAMQDILRQLTMNPFEEFTQRELAMMIDADVSSVSRSIALLDQLGVLEIDAGRPARIRLDRDHFTCSDPLFLIDQTEFRKPVQAFCESLEARIESSRSITGPDGIVLFGSVARGTADRRSDIDLLVILSGDETHGRRMGSRIKRDLEERSFDGDRYEFDLLIETPTSALSSVEKLRPIFDQGLIVKHTSTLSGLRRVVYEET